MRFGSVCSGIEAASVAWNPLGWHAAWVAEIEPFPCAVLAHHYPDVPNLGDMTTIARRVLIGEVEAPDILCGGTPCQAFSVAGLRNSLDDARGNLTLKFVELADAIDFSRTQRGADPAIVFWENVPGVLSTKDNAFGCFLAGLAGEDDPLQPPGGKWSNAGAVYGPRRAVAWRTLDAQYFGVAQRRRRVFIVASARNGFDPAQVLFEWHGLRRDTAPRREAGQSAAAGTLRSTDGGSDVDHAKAGHIQPFDLGIRAFGYGATCKETDAARALHAHPGGTRLNFETETFLVQPTHTLRGEGFDASEDGTGRGTPLVPVAFDTTQITSQTNRSNPQPGDPCHPLAAGAHAPAIALSVNQDQDLMTYRDAMGLEHWPTPGAPNIPAAIAFPANLSGTQCASSEDLSPALGALNPTAVAFSSKDYGGDATSDLAPTLRAMNHADSHANGGGQMAVAHATQVRRLTPTECERLQGFPDGYTVIPWRKKPASECPDGPRYKALGNSWAVPNVRWLGQRIQAAISQQGIGS